jgi:hypothetical protein
MTTTSGSGSPAGVVVGRTRRPRSLLTGPVVVATQCSSTSGHALITS